MRACLPALPLLLAGCAQPSADLYRFGPAEYRRTDLTVRVVEHDSEKGIAVAAAAWGASSDRGGALQGFTEIHTKTGLCVIHIIKPEISYRPEWIGHEFAHCVYGRWHD